MNLYLRGCVFKTLIISPSLYLRFAKEPSPWRFCFRYKATMSFHGDGNRKEFLADVSSFANTDGGMTIFGISEASGLPIQANGFNCTDADAWGPLWAHSSVWWSWVPHWKIVYGCCRGPGIQGLLIYLPLTSLDQPKLPFLKECYSKMKIRSVEELAGRFHTQWWHCSSVL